MYVCIFGAWAYMWSSPLSGYSWPKPLMATITLENNITRLSKSEKRGIMVVRISHQNVVKEYEICGNNEIVFIFYP